MKVKVRKMKKNMFKKISVIAMSMVMIICFGLMFQGDYVNAIAKAPAKVKNLKVKVSDMSLKASWKKSKGAKRYHVYIKKGKKWDKVKSVKKNTAVLKFKKPISSQLKVRGVAKKAGKFSKAVKFSIKKNHSVSGKKPVVNPGNKEKVVNTSSAVTVYGKTVKINESKADVEKDFGTDYVVKRSGTKYVWHIYNAYRDQKNILFVGFDEKGVAAIYTSAVGWEYRDDRYFKESLKDGDKWTTANPPDKNGQVSFINPDKNSVQYKTGISMDMAAYVKPMFDRFDDHKIYGILVERYTPIPNKLCYKYDDELRENGKRYFERISKDEQDKVCLDFEDQEIYLINAMRARANVNNYQGKSGRVMLTKDEELTQYARNWAKHLAEIKEVEHNMGESGFGGYMENCSGGNFDTSIGDINGFINETNNKAGKDDRGHRELILSASKSYSKIGVGVQYKDGFLAFVQDFN